VIASSTLPSDALDDSRLVSEPRTVAERVVERTLFGCRWRAALRLALPHRLIGSRPMLIAVVVSIALATGTPSLAQRADSNIGLEGGHSGLVDSVLATPNRKTPVPQDNIFATAPGAQQPAPMPQPNTKASGTSRIINRTFPEAHQ